MNLIGRELILSMKNKVNSWWLHIHRHHFYRNNDNYTDFLGEGAQE